VTTAPVGVTVNFACSTRLTYGPFGTPVARKRFIAGVSAVQS
jgi:hypothetical protein